jgi:hypothetical protein
MLLTTPWQILKTFFNIFIRFFVRSKSRNVNELTKEEYIRKFKKYIELSRWNDLHKLKGRERPPEIINYLNYVENKHLCIYAKGSTPLMKYLKNNEKYDNDIIKLLLTDKSKETNAVYGYVQKTTNINEEIIELLITVDDTSKYLLSDYYCKFNPHVNLQSVKILMKYQGINTHSDRGRYPLHAYLDNKNVETDIEIVKILASDDLIIKMKPQLPISLYLKNTEKFDKNIINFLRFGDMKPDEYCETPLHIYLGSCKKYDLEIAKQLFNPSYRTLRNYKGYTPADEMYYNLGKVSNGLITFTSKKEVRNCPKIHRIYDDLHIRPCDEKPYNIPPYSKDGSTWK